MVQATFLLLVAAAAMVEASFLYGKGEQGKVESTLWNNQEAKGWGGDLWKGMGDSLDLWKGKGDKGLLWKGKGDKGHLWKGKGIKGWDKGVPSLETSCKLVYDDVWEEKCQTVYNDQCQDVPQKECQVVQEKECSLKETEECSFVMEDKCASIPIPVCSVKWEKKCSKQPVCRTEYDEKCLDTVKTICTTVNDHKCIFVNKDVCTTKSNQQCKTLLDKVCKLVPVVVPQSVPTAESWSTGASGGVDPAWTASSSEGLPFENQVDLSSFKGKFTGTPGGFRESPAYVKVPRQPDNIIPSDPSLGGTVGGPAAYPAEFGVLSDDPAAFKDPVVKTNLRRRRRSAVTIPRATYGREPLDQERMPRTIHEDNEELLRDSDFQLPRSSRDERSISELLAKKVAAKLRTKAAILEAKKNLKLEKAAILMGGLGKGWSQDAPPAMMSMQPEIWVESATPTMKPTTQVEYVEMCQKVPRKVCTDNPEKVCHQVPQEQCHDVPREECRDVPDKLCSTTPRQVCEDKEFCKEMPTQSCDVQEKQKCTPFPSRKCVKVPKEQCRTYPREVCSDVVKQKCTVIPDKLCKKMTVKRPREVCLPSAGSASPSSSAWAGDDFKGELSKASSFLPDLGGFL